MILKYAQFCGYGTDVPVLILELEENIITTHNVFRIHAGNAISSLSDFEICNMYSDMKWDFFSFFYHVI